MDKRTEEILNKIYNLILDTDIHKNERDILLRYKILLENTKNEQRVVMELAEALRQQAVSGITNQWAQRLRHFIKKLPHMDNWVKI